MNSASSGQAPIVRPAPSLTIEVVDEQGADLGIQRLSYFVIDLYKLIKHR